MKLFCLGMLLFFSWTAVGGAQDAELVGTIYEPLKPGFILVDEGQLYLAEGPTIHIYRLDGFKEIARFGKAGEGPEEFGSGRGGLTLFLQDRQLVVNAQTKLNFYSRDGKFVRTMKVGGGRFGGNFMPVDNGYLGISVNLDQKQQGMTMAVSLYDRELNKKKDLRQTFFSPMSGKFNLFETMRQMSYEAKGDRLYLLSDDDEAVSVFDLDGTERKRIALQLEKVPLTQGDIDNILVQFGRNVPAAQRDSLKDRFEFPEFYPPMIRMIVDGNHLFLMSWKRSAKGSLAAVYDTESGKKLKELYLPLHFENGIQPFPFTYFKGMYYAVNELPDEEEEDEVIYKVVRVPLF